MKILIVEDEPELRETMISYLGEEGYRCEEALTLEQGMEKVNLYEYDCLLLDVGLPDGNGLNLIGELKKACPQTGIIIVSAKNSLDDKISGLDLGADDYLTKPFHLSELNSRLKSVLRRRKFNGKKEMIFHELKIVPDDKQAYINDEPLSLTKKEYDLLVFFMTNPGRVLTKESIAEHLWGDFADASDTFDFVYSHIKNLRRKIVEKSGTDYFRNVYGTGYSLGMKEE